MDDPRAGAAATADPKPEATEEAPQPTEAVEETGAAAVQEPDWRHHLDEAPVEDLRSHPRVAGIVGQMVDQAMRRFEAKQRDEMSSRAKADAERELLALAEQDPFAFAQKYLSDKQAQDAQAKLERAQTDLAAHQAARFATAIGTALKDVPEWREMSKDEFEALAKEVGNDSDPEIVFKKFLPRALDAIAGKRSEKTYQARFDKEFKAAVEKEVEARVKESLAARRPRQQRPDLARPAAAETNTLDKIEAMNDREYNQWYEANVLGKL